MDKGIVYTYTCPICEEEYYAHFYHGHMPRINETIVCGCDHCLIAVNVDNDNKTIDYRAIGSLGLAV